MNREQLIEQLELQFSRGAISDDLRRAAEKNPEAARVLAELDALGKLMSDLPEEAFTDAEIEDACLHVEHRLSDRPQTVIVPLTWLRTLTRVAAAVLVVAVSYGGLRFGSLTQMADTNTSTVAAVTEGSSWSDLFYDTPMTDTLSVADLDENMVDVLIEDYTSKTYFDAPEQLLGDLTDEELKYLEETMTVGEIL